VTAYTHTCSDVEACMGNRAKAEQVAGHFNTPIMLRVKEPVTADMLTDQFPRVEVFTLMSVSGVDDTSEPGSEVDFKSRNEDRISVSEVPMLTPAELITLPKGQAFANFSNLLEGKLFFEPYAEKNVYDLNRIVLMLHENGCGNMHLRLFRNGNQQDAILLFQKKRDRAVPHETFYNQ
jgi:hypothetical protein